MFFLSKHFHGSHLIFTQYFFSFVWSGGTEVCEMFNKFLSAIK